MDIANETTWHTVTWDELVKLEPELGPLVQQTEQGDDHTWHFQVRSKLNNLIGHGRPWPGLVPTSFPDDSMNVAADWPIYEENLKAEQEARAALPPDSPEELLHSSEAWDVALKHLNELRPYPHEVRRNKERLE